MVEICDIVAIIQMLWIKSMTDSMTLPSKKGRTHSPTKPKTTPQYQYSLGLLIAIGLNV